MARKFPEDPQTLPPASLTRRMAAMLYDGMICFALLIVVTGLYTAAHKGLIGAGLLADRYADMMETDQIGHDPVLFLVLFGSIFWFFGHFWTRTGQTIGMQAWRIRIQNADGTSVAWLQVFMRMLLGVASWAPAGLGYIWQLWDKNTLSWTDRYSDSITVTLPKPEKKKAKSD